MVRNDRVKLSSVPLITLERNTDSVQVNSYDEFLTAGDGFTCFVSPGITMASVYKGERIRQTGTINKIKFTQQVKVNTTNIYLYVWRSTGVENYFDMVFGGEVTLADIAVGTNTYILPTPANVQEGDYMGWRGIANPQSNEGITFTARTDGTLYSTILTPAAEDNLIGTGNHTQSTVVAYGKAPLAICIGDSEMESYPENTSFVDVGRDSVDIEWSWTYKLAQLDARFIYQNMGI